MRDSARIQRITDKLAEYWLRVPDWRFCQLMENVKTFTGKNDLFFIEDDEFEEILDYFFLTQIER